MNSNNYSIKKSLFKSYSIKRGIIINVTLLFVLLIIFFLSLTIGKLKIPLSDIFKLGTSSANPTYKLIVSRRIPKFVLAFLVGVAMGISGSVMQDMLHNNLASPGTLGVSAGSSIFVSIYLAFIKKQNSPLILLPILALIGGLCAAGIIFLLSISKKKKTSPTKLIMNGIAISSVMGAFGLFLSVMLDKSRLEAIQRWNAGELWGTNWNLILIFTIWSLYFIYFIYKNAQTINVIKSGYDVSIGLGVNVKFRFFQLIICAVALAAGAVSFGGNFFFLGLIGPHIAKKLVGDNNKVLLPAAGLIAAIIVTLSNFLVNSISFLTNLPTGIIISILSVPYFIYLLIRSK